MIRIKDVCVSDKGACPFWAVLVALLLVILTATVVPVVIHGILNLADVLTFLDQIPVAGKIVFSLLISGVVVGATVRRTGCNCPCKLLRIGCHP